MIDDLYAASKDTLRVHTGGFVNILEPQPEEIFVDDIAIGLARACRWAGHTKRFYSVAEHSLWCKHKADSLYPDDVELPFKALLHDAHEYLLGDVAKPLKRMIPGYDAIAQKLQNTIHKRYGISITNQDEERIKELDRLALEWEWENKVIKSTGAVFEEAVIAGMFISCFVRLCKVPC